MAFSGGNETSDVIWVRVPRELRLDGVSVPVGVQLAAVPVQLMTGFRAPAVKILIGEKVLVLWADEYERSAPPPVQVVSVGRFRGIDDDEEI